MTLVVAAALVDDLAQPTRLLAARRTGPAALAGQWELPGGKAEPGEDPEDALSRELVEELAVTLHLGPRLPGPAGGDWPVPPGRMRVWWCQIASGDPTPREVHDELRWLPLDALQTVPWLAADLPVLVALQSTHGVGAE